MRFFDVIMSIILGLIVLVLIYIFYIKAQSGVQSLADSTICKKSVEMNALFRYDRIQGFTDFKCPMLVINTKSTNKKAVFETLALALSDTWNEFLEGRTEIFDTKTDNYCVVRRIVKFSEAQKYKGFFDYLLSHNPPSIKMPYYTYLTGIEVNEGVRTLKDNKQLKDEEIGEINTSYPYAAIFMMSKKANFGKIFGAEVGGAVGGIVGLISSGTLLYYAGGLIPGGILLKAKLLLAGGAAGGLAGGVTGFVLGNANPANWDAGMALIPYTEENLKTLDCTKLPVGAV